MDSRSKRYTHLIPQFLVLIAWLWSFINAFVSRATLDIALHDTYLVLFWWQVIIPFLVFQGLHFLLIFRYSKRRKLKLGFSIISGIIGLISVLFISRYMNFTTAGIPRRYYSFGAADTSAITDLFLGLGGWASMVLITLFFLSFFVSFINVYFSPRLEEKKEDPNILDA